MRTAHLTHQLKRPPCIVILGPDQHVLGKNKGDCKFSLSRELLGRFNFLVVPHRWPDINSLARDSG